LYWYYHKRKKIDLLILLMKILITAPSLNATQNISGVSTVVNTIIKHNKANQYFHYLLGRPDKELSKLIWLGQFLQQILLFPFVLKQNKIDLVHQNLPFDPKGVLREFFINLWCRLLHAPVVLHVHGGVFLMNGTTNIIFKKLAQSLFKHSKQVLILSELEKEALQKHYQYSEAIVLYNSIDTSYYANKQNELAKTKPTLLFLGRIHESKGVDDLIEALRLLKQKMDFRFLLCGIGPLKDHFISECNDILVSDFEYHGIVSGDEKLNIIKEANFFLLPSRYGEGLPMAMLETMAAGVVPVVTDDASMKFVVQHEINGIRVNKNDPKDLFEKLDYIINQPELYKLLSENARKTIAEKYDIKKYVIKLNKIYQSALNQY